MKINLNDISKQNQEIKQIHPSNHWNSNMIHQQELLIYKKIWGLDIIKTTNQQMKIHNDQDALECTNLINQRSNFNNYICNENINESINTFEIETSLKYKKFV